MWPATTGGGNKGNKRNKKQGKRHPAEGRGPPIVAPVSQKGNKTQGKRHPAEGRGPSIVAPVRQIGRTIVASSMDPDLRRDDYWIPTCGGITVYTVVASERLIPPASLSPMPIAISPTRRCST